MADASFEVKYSKTVGAKCVTIQIESLDNKPLGMLDVLRALASVVSNILNTGKY